MWLPRTAVSVDLFHVTMLANDMLTTVRQGLSQHLIPVTENNEEVRIMDNIRARPESTRNGWARIQSTSPP